MLLDIRTACGQNVALTMFVHRQAKKEPREGVSGYKDVEGSRQEEEISDTIGRMEYGGLCFDVRLQLHAPALAPASLVWRVHWAGVLS